MLGKHIWTILKDTTKPRVQVVNAKYLHGESILRSRQFPGASCTWMSLMEAAESLEPGFKFRVGQEGNNCADWLAKKGASEDQQMVIVNVCPASLKSKVLADALGVFFTRSS
ncbi:hypothetical protein JHK87_056063 [Glycine soja]|uniref:RNase H type-1 domain-containing protein n=1 Tax=Glycine max TaxID=3847 RepID=A0A0R0EA49_SOYBN|nr:hypothetical protein JHK87_056063 [Glycine soja]